MLMGDSRQLRIPVRANGRGTAVWVHGAVLAPRGLVAFYRPPAALYCSTTLAGDAPALAYRQAVLLRPGPNVTRALAVGRGAARLRPPGRAGVLQVGRELLAELRGVLGVQVDLIVGAVKREPDSLLGRAAGQVIFKEDGYFLGHVFTFRPS